MTDETKSWMTVLDEIAELKKPRIKKYYCNFCRKEIDPLLIKYGCFFCNYCGHEYEEFF